MPQLNEQTLVTIEDTLTHRSDRKARELIRSFNTRRIPRELRYRFANVARRSFLPGLSLQVLAPIVRPKTRARRTEPTPLEVAEYAAALRDLGALREALALLESVDHSVAPRIDLFLGFVTESIWDHERSTTHYSATIARDDTKELTRLRAEVGLASSLIDEHGERDCSAAILHLEDVLRRCGPERYRQMYKDGLILLAKTAVFGNEFERAERLLDDLAALSAEDKDEIWGPTGREWRQMIRLKKGATLASVAAELDDVSAIRDRLGRWSYNRSAHFYAALITRNEKLLTHIYFGTSFPAFRRRILGILGRAQKEMPSTYLWRPGAGLQSIIEETPASGRSVDLRKCLSPGSVTQRLLLALSTDFYLPKRVAELHELLYPGEYFSITSSPGRVHQTLYRLRQDLKDARLPLSVTEQDGHFRLVARPGWSIRVDARIEADLLSASGNEARLTGHLAVLGDAFGDREFSAQDAAAALELSYRSTVRYLSQSVERGELLKIRNGLQIRYRIAG